LPFSGAAKHEGDYLREVVRRGGDMAAAYKQLSLQLLNLGSGQRVLDVGCGSGVDLNALSEAVGSDGHVIGIDHSSDRVRDARAAMKASGRSNVTVLHANVEHLTVPSGEFDRVRADRVIQHINDHRTALTEMWRVLVPEGILSVVEPDWASIIIAPASAKVEDDDTALAHVLSWIRRHVRHPLIGRQLHGLLQEQGPQAWQEIVVTTEAYTFTDWSVVDAVLQLSNAAQALMLEQPELTDEIQTWRQAAEVASRRGTFFAAIPLFFATARKAS
jgi:ubiquinone/menaquinone biosynthesis C-methylase UbiE